MNEGTLQPLAYSIPDAVKVSGLGRSFIYEEIAAKRLPIVKRGTRTLILREDLEAYLRAGRVAE